jgi:L-fuculose-phosphate aldolase
MRREIVDVHRRLYDLGFSVANDGNTSIKLDANRILITPTGDLNKAKLRPDQIAVIDTEGRTLSGHHAPSSEIAVHLFSYRARPDVRAIIHAHPPHSIALSLSGFALTEPLLPEVILSLGEIPCTPYVTPGTEEAGRAVAELITNHDAIILTRHGSVTVGKTLDEAMQKLERMEHTAKIVSIAKAIGPVTPLTKVDLDRLAQRMGKPVFSETKLESRPAPDSNVVELIARQVADELLAKRKSS